MSTGKNTTKKSTREVTVIKPPPEPFKCGFLHLMLLKGAVKRWAKSIRIKLHKRKLRESFFQENYGVINSVLRKNREDCIMLKKNHPVNQTTIMSGLYDKIVDRSSHKTYGLGVTSKSVDWNKHFSDKEP